MALYYTIFVPFFFLLYDCEIIIIIKINKLQNVFIPSHWNHCGKASKGGMTTSTLPLNKPQITLFPSCWQILRA